MTSSLMSHTDVGQRFWKVLIRNEHRRTTLNALDPEVMLEVKHELSKIRSLEVVCVSVRCRVRFCRYTRSFYKMSVFVKKKKTVLSLSLMLK